MPKKKWETIFSVDEGDGQYRVIYNKELDSEQIVHKLPGALFLIMKQYPELIDEIIFACTKAADELAEPFNDILNERPS